MNISELARRLRVGTDDLRAQLPTLGFSIGRHAIKINDREAQRIMEAWADYQRRLRLTAKRDEQMARAEAQRSGDKPVLEKKVQLPLVISVRDFASKLDLPIAKVMQELLRNGILASLNERIDFDTAAIVAEDLGYAAEKEEVSADPDADDAGTQRLEDMLKGEEKSLLAPRPPVIVVMGHVDHGKTKLLDAIRSANVMESEAGGITQHIGAYQVTRKNKLITFIDTPGHEAFTVMRSRGAKVADIAILVVAADDGVQPQTKEAVDIIKAAGLPYVVAINKIDKADANIEKVKGQLAELNLIPEEWGGKTLIVPVSAKAGTGIDDLLDVLLLVNDMEKEKISANPERRAAGTIIDSKIDKGAGPVATVLVQSGTLKLGDIIGVRGALYGRVRFMKDWRGESVQEAGPSMPVKVLGFKAAPAVGDVLEVPEDAKALDKMKDKPMRTGVSETVTSRPNASESKEGKKFLNLIVRADVLGSLEAFLGLLEKIKHEALGVEVVAKGLGNITDADVLKAEATSSIIYAFGTRPSTSAAELARDKKIEIVQNAIIYKLFEDILERLQKMLPSEEVLTEMAKIEVLAVFKKTDKGGIVGGRVLGDKVRAPSKMRILRAGAVVGEGEIIRLQFAKQAMKEVSGGSECGVEFTSRTKIEIGDILETYTEESKRRILKIEGVDLR